MVEGDARERSQGDSQFILGQLMIDTIAQIICAISCVVVLVLAIIMTKEMRLINKKWDDTWHHILKNRDDIADIMANKEKRMK